MANKAVTTQHKLLWLYEEMEDITSRLGELRPTRSGGLSQLGVLLERLEMVTARFGSVISDVKPEGVER